MGRLAFKRVTIPSSGTVSDAADLGDEPLVGLILPTIDNATISFQAADADNATGVAGTFRALKDVAGNVVTLPASTGNVYVALDSALFAGIRHVKVVAGAAQTGGARTIVLATRG